MLSSVYISTLACLSSSASNVLVSSAHVLCFMFQCGTASARVSRTCSAHTLCSRALLTRSALCFSVGQRQLVCLARALLTCSAYVLCSHALLYVSVWDSVSSSVSAWASVSSCVSHVLCSRALLTCSALCVSYVLCSHASAGVPRTCSALCFSVGQRQLVCLACALLTCSAHLLCFMFQRGAASARVSRTCSAQEDTSARAR